jgi:mycothiol synthase
MSATTSAVDLRPFDPASDFPAITELIRDVSTQTGADWFPTVEALSIEWSRARNFEPVRDCVVATDAGRVVGLARVSWREREGGVVHRIELWVRPDRMREGIGRRLLAWGETRARASVLDGSGGPAELPHLFGGATDLGREAGTAFAAGAGYSPIRYHYEMRRDLSAPIPDAPVPDGLEIRPVEPEHHRAIWLADAEAFRDHWDASAIHEDDFVRFFAHPDIDTALWQVAWDGDEIAGLVLNAIYREENAQIGVDIGWVDGVATRRPWRGRGVASALLSRSLVLLRERGMTVAALGVDTENPSGALGLYERFGFAPVRTWAFYRKPF